MRYLWLLLLVVSAASAAHAQDCTPQPFRKMGAGAIGQQIVPAASDETTNLVAPGMVEVVTDASIGYMTDPNEDLHYSIIKQIHWGPGSWWFHAWTRTSAPTHLTPVLGASSATGLGLLFPGERLGARATINTGSMYVMYTGVTFPLSCLARYFGLEAQAGGPTPPPPPPDFSALVAAAQAAAAAQLAAAEALTELAGSVP